MRQPVFVCLFYVYGTVSSLLVYKHLLKSLFWEGRVLKTGVKTGVKA